MNLDAPTAISPSGQSDPYEFSNYSSAGSECSNTTTIRAAIELHRHNSQLLREKMEIESKHNEEITTLLRQIQELKNENAELSSSKASCVANEKRLNEEVNALVENKAKLELEIAERRGREHLLQEVETLREQLRLLHQENERKDVQLHDWKRKSVDLRRELAEKIEEILLLHKLRDSKDSEIERLKTAVLDRDEQLMTLRSERDADDARMLAVKDVQLAYEELRKSGQEKDRHIQDLEEVLHATIREKQQSALVHKSQEEARLAAKELKEYKVSAERRYEDACQQYVAQLHDLHITSYGAENYPGKSDNLPAGANNSAANGVAATDDASDTGCLHQSASRNRSFFDLNKSVRRPRNMWAAEAVRTIEAIRGEYDIEVRRSEALQQDITHLTTERDRLRVELYGEIQNESLSSLNCVLAAQNGASASSTSRGGLSRQFICLKQELQSCIRERDAAKAELMHERSECEQVWMQNRDLREQLSQYETEITNLLADRKALRRFQYDYVFAQNRCKALIYQKQYLQTELSHLRTTCRDLCRPSTRINGLNKPASSHCLFSSPLSPLRRFKAVGYVFMAIARMTRMAERRNHRTGSVIE